MCELHMKLDFITVLLNTQVEFYLWSLILHDLYLQNLPIPFESRPKCGKDQRNDGFYAQ